MMIKKRTSNIPIRIAQTLIALIVFVSPVAKSEICFDGSFINEYNTGSCAASGGSVAYCPGFGTIQAPIVTSGVGGIDTLYGAITFNSCPPGPTCCGADAIHINDTSYVNVQSFASPFFPAIDSQSAAINIVAGGSPNNINIGLGMTIRGGTYGVLNSAGALNGLNNNAGTITSSGTGISIQSASPNGTISNYVDTTFQVGGFINGTDYGIQITGAGSLQSIFNDAFHLGSSSHGVIQNNHGSPNATIDGSGITTGAGITQTSAITFGITNLGVIQNTGGPNAIVLNPAKLGSLFNNGHIIGNVVLGTVNTPGTDVTFQMADAVNSFYFPSEITGNVTLTSSQNNLVILQGGNIAGTLNGGTLNDTYFVSGDATFNAISDPGGTNSLTVNGGGTVQPNGSISGVQTITVDAGTTFNSVGAITGLTTLNVNGIMNETSTIDNNTVTPINLTLTGALNINSGGTTNGFLLQAASSGGTLTVNTGGKIDSETVGLDPAIKSQAGASVTSITNFGTIKVASSANTAIDLSAVVTTAPLFQEAGSITGAVNLASSGGTVLTFDAGTISGNITASNHAANTVQLNGGSNLGFLLQMGNVGDIVNLAGSTMGDIRGGSGADTYNISVSNGANVCSTPAGGSFTTLNGNAGADVINIIGAGTTVNLCGKICENSTGTCAAPAGVHSPISIYVNPPASTPPSSSVNAIVNGTIDDVGILTTYLDGNMTVNNTITGFNPLAPTGILTANGNVVINALPGAIDYFNSMVFSGPGPIALDQFGAILGLISTTTMSTTNTYVLETGGTVDAVKSLTCTGPRVTFNGNIGVLGSFGTILVDSPATQSGQIRGTIASSTVTFNNTYTLFSPGSITQVNTITLNGTSTLNNGTTIGNFNLLTLNATATLDGTIDGQYSVGPFPVTPDITTGAFSNVTNDISGAIQNIDTITLQSVFTQNGTMNNINTIDVANGGALNVNSPITLLNTVLQMDPGGNAQVNAQISGGASVLNNGNLIITNNGFVNVSGALGYRGTGNLTLFSTPIDGDNMTVAQFHQQAGTIMTVDFTNDTNWGSVKTLGGPILFDAGSFITPAFFNETTYIPDDTLFPIVYGGPVTDNGAVIIQPVTPIVSFTKLITGGGTIFNLVFHRASYTHCASNPITISIAQILDEMALNNGFNNADLQNLIFQLDAVATCSQINIDLQALSPDVSYGMIKGAHIGMDRTFGTLWQRLEDIKQFREPWYGGHYRPYPGFNAGDDDNPHLEGFWVAPYGEWANQYQIDYNQGYRAGAVGAAMGYDHSYFDGTVLGLAASYTRVHVVGSFEEHNVENVGSIQGTVYGMWQPWDAVYVDLMFGIASNKFQNNRNVNIGDINLSAYSAFYGWQLGGQFDIGYVDCETDFYIAPIGRVKGTYLHLQSFTERNAGGIGLHTSERALPELLGGGGLRLAKQRVGYPYAYMYEAAILYLYDFADKGQQTVANFIGGGTAFPTIGVRPPRNVLLVDLGFEAFAVEDKSNVVTLRYEFELREKFSANSGFVELYHRWC